MTNLKPPRIDHRTLVYSGTITTNIRAGAAQKAIIEYVTGLRYQQVQTKPSLKFERGSSLAGFYDTNPSRQKTLWTVDILSAGTETLIEYTMHIHRAGNLPLKPDYDFWEAEQIGLQDVFTYGYSNPLMSIYAADRANWYNIAILLMVLVAVLATSLIIVLWIVAR